MQLGAITADIIVDGKELDQFDVVKESPTKVTCWIASEEGKSFSVKWTCHEELRASASTIEGSVYVDGIGCGRNFTQPGKPGEGGPAILSQLKNGTTARKLMFAHIQLSDDDSLLERRIPAHLGEIRLKIRRGKLVKDKQRGVPKSDDPVPKDQIFHERSKKATVHCVGFGPKVLVKRSTYKYHLTPNDDPLLTFVFKYQPLSVLQASGIAPRTNGPGNSHKTSSGARNAGTDDNVINVSDSEDVKPAELDAHIQNLENKLKRLRDLKSGNFEERKPKRFKKEEQKDTSFVPGEVIDLT